MNTTQHLSGSHLRTYNTIFQHPISHNLEWRAVHGLLRFLCSVEDEANGSLKATRNGQTLVLHPSREKDVSETDEVMVLRRFLERSEDKPKQPGAEVAHWLLVIDHHEARIYSCEMEGSAPLRILPHLPDEYFRHAHNSRDFSRGREKPEPNSFFEPVANALRVPGRIFVFGSGTGTSSEMDQFLGWVKIHYPETARRIVGSRVVDGHHLTEGQLLSEARKFFARPEAA